jgi:hypothetical protein
MQLVNRRLAGNTHYAIPIGGLAGTTIPPPHVGQAAVPQLTKPP